MSLTSQKSQLAIFDGDKAVKNEDQKIFEWPLITEEDEQAVLDVLRQKKMSGMDVAIEFEKQFAEWNGMKYALSAPNGTSAIQEAMFALGIGAGDEVIVPSLTYWASLIQLYSLFAVPVFADVSEENLCIDPADIERKITPRTKAIVVVHYCSMPAEMDPIMEIAKKHNLKVFEDVSHAQGGLYKGKMLGSFGDASAMSLMSGKSLAIGEGGIWLTNDRKTYERGILFGHYARQNREGELTDPELIKMKGLPLGGYKNRLNQTVAAMGKVQLKHYPERMAEIDKAMTYFWDQLEDIDGISGLRVDKSTGSTNAGWYSALGRYDSSKFKGLSISKFCEALNAEGLPTAAGCNIPLHKHPLFSTIDVYHHGQPTIKALAKADIDTNPSLPVTESISQKVFRVPWFKHCQTDIIDQYVNAVKKVAQNYEKLLETDQGNKDIGSWGLSGIR